MQCPKLKIRNRIYSNVSFLYFTWNFPQRSACLYVNLWKLYAQSIICHQHQPKFAIGRRITIWALKQNGKKVWPMVQYLAFGILTKTCFICIHYVYLTFMIMFLLISVNTIYSNEADFLYDIKWQDTASSVTLFCHFVLALKVFSGCKCCVIPVTNYWMHINCHRFVVLW